MINRIVTLLRSALAHLLARAYVARYRGGYTVSAWSADPNAGGQYDAPPSTRRKVGKP